MKKLKNLQQQKNSMIKILDKKENKKFNKKKVIKKFYKKKKLNNTDFW